MSAPSAAARLLLAFLAARSAFGLAYLIGSARRWPIPLYYPLERRFAIESAPHGLAMEWYGRTAVALACALVVFAVAWTLSARGPLARAAGRPATALAIARAAGLILLVDFAYFGWVLMHQTPAPLPLPPGSCLR